MIRISTLYIDAIVIYKMLSKLFSAALLATSFMYTDAACNFRSRALIFPDCNDGATDTACPFTISEITPNATNDDNVTVTINWNNAMPGVDDNKYFLLDRASSDTGTYGQDNFGSPLDYALDDHLDAAGSVYRSFALKEPDSTDCMMKAARFITTSPSRLVPHPPAMDLTMRPTFTHAPCINSELPSNGFASTGYNFSDWANVRTELIHCRPMRRSGCRIPSQKRSDC